MTMWETLRLLLISDASEGLGEPAKPDRKFFERWLCWAMCWANVETVSPRRCSISFGDNFKMHGSVLTSFGPISRYNTFCVLNQCSPRKYNLPEKADLNFFRNTMIMLRCCSEHYLTKKIMLHRKRKDHAPPETWSDDFPMLSNCKPTHNSHIRK